MLFSSRLFVLCKLTNVCNQSCRHCVTEANCTEACNLPFDLFIDLLNDIYSIDSNGVLSLIGGEATLWPHFFDVLNLKPFRQLSYKKLNTNATAVNASELLKLANAGFYEIRISIDSDRPIEHDDLRGIGTFEKAVQSTKELLRLHAPVTAGTVISKKNVSRTSQIVSFLNNTGVSAIHFFPYVEKGRGFMQREYVADEMTKKEFFTHLETCEFEIEKKHSPKCQTGTAYFKIVEDGTCSIHFAEKNIHGIVLGNLHQTRFFDLFDKAKKTLPLEDCICSGCPYENDLLMCENMHNYCMADLDFRVEQK